MSLTRKAFVVGGANTDFIGKGHPDFISKRHPDFGSRENPTWEELLQQAVDELIVDTDVNPHDVDRLYIGNFTGELFVDQGHMGAALAGTHPAFSGKPAARLEGACASGGLAVLSGLDAIAAGADIVLVAGVEVQTTKSAREGAGFLARAAHYSRQRGLDSFTFPAMFARRMKAYQEGYGIDKESLELDLGRVSVKAFANARLNPKAHMKAAELSIEVAGSINDSNFCFLGNEELKPYMRLRDCSQVSDGASAILLCSEQGLQKLQRSAESCVEVIGRGHAVGSLYTDGDLLQLHNSRAAAYQAYDSAGVNASDIDIAEVHDCFSITEIMMYEAAGFADFGKGTELVRSGATEIGGSIPINTGGGLIGFGHPVGATGVKQVLEIYRQMKGLCGDYQVEKSCNLGLTLNMGGDDKTAVALVLKNG